MKLLRAAIAILPATMASAFAFDDKHFCGAVQQLAIAAETDVGIWIDRVTRNAGMAVACDKKKITFTRFTYSASATMTDQWKAAKVSEWNAAQCNSLLWKEAIDNGWTIVLDIATADGGRATFNAQCK
jgi:hypothetical protein